MRPLAGAVLVLAMGACASPDAPADPGAKPVASRSTTAPPQAAPDCPADEVLADRVRDGALRGTDITLVFMCGAVYTGSVGDLAAPAEALTTGVDALVDRLRSTPDTRSMACSDVGGVEPFYLVFLHGDGSLDALAQADCSGFEIGGESREGNLGTFFAQAVADQRVALSPPSAAPPSPTCDALEDGDSPQSLLGEVEDIRAATLCVVPDGGSGASQVTQEIPLTGDDVKVVLDDVREHSRDPDDGLSLTTDCADPSTELDLVGVTAWNDVVTLSAPFCRDFYNHELEWEPSEAGMELLDRLVGPATAS